MIPQHYNTEYIASKLSVDPRTIRSAIKAKKLQAVKLGNEFRITEDAANAWIESRTLKANTKPKNKTA